MQLVRRQDAVGAILATPHAPPRLLAALCAPRGRRRRRHLEPHRRVSERIGAQCAVGGAGALGRALPEGCNPRQQRRRLLLL
eukprot:3912613-Prymnesium_polylepis.1